MGIIAKVFRGKIPKSHKGTYAFRGQANAGWKLHSSATRRLIKEGYIQTTRWGQISDGRLCDVYKSYHKDELIVPARTAGFDIEEGREVSDLQLLAKLQHFGAATGLIDFTWNPLIALWFACAECPKQDGKVFVVNLNDPSRYECVSNGKETIDDLFPPYDGRSLLLYWEPKARSEAAARILVQQSVFVLARSRTLEEVEEKITEITIKSSDKNKIVKELADLGITQLSLLRDIHGFSMVNDHSAPVRRMNNPYVYLRRGNQFYQQAAYEIAIESYDRCIAAIRKVPVRGSYNLYPPRDLWQILFNRGNAKAELGRYEDALQDYNDAVQPASKFARWWILFNRGNAKAALGRYKEALQDYHNAAQLARETHSESLTGVIFFNQANAKTILGEYEEAVQDYDKAIRLATTEVGKNNARFNKGNVLVMSGRFLEAQQCYDESARQGDSSVAGNRKSLEGILQSIGAKHKSNTERDPDGRVRVVVTVNDGSRGGSRASQEFVFAGNVGSMGNVGGILVMVPGGKRYPEYPPFLVQVKPGNPPPQPVPTAT